jgi:hypothetical protein
MRPVCVRLLLIIAMALALPSRGMAQVKVLLENESVRVYEVSIKAGMTEPGFHKHVVPYVFYVLNGGRATVRSETGAAQAVEYKVGEVRWGGVEAHAVDNVGPTDIRVLIVDLKTSPVGQDVRDELVGKGRM